MLRSSLNMVLRSQPAQFENGYVSLLEVAASSMSAILQRRQMSASDIKNGGSPNAALGLASAVISPSVKMQNRRCCPCLLCRLVPGFRCSLNASLMYRRAPCHLAI